MEEVRYRDTHKHVLSDGNFCDNRHSATSLSGVNDFLVALFAFIFRLGQHRPKKPVLHIILQRLS